MGVVLAWAIVWRWVGGLTAARRGLDRRHQHPRRHHPEDLRQHLPARRRRRDRRLPLRPAPADGRRSATVPSVPPPPRPSASGWPAWCTTGCCRCWRSCSGVLRSSAPTAVELGRLAGEQEVRLRGLVQQDSRDLVAPLGDRDLVQLLAELQSARVHVAVPGTPAMLPAERASEVLAAVESCLSNVRHHVGRDAEAWVLLEELDDRWVVSVRDDGPGIPEGRLEASAAEGRLGVQQSIVGRLHDLGGTATGALGGRSGHRVGARRCRDDDPLGAPLPRPGPRSGTPPPRSARRGGHALDERLGRRRAGPHRLVGDGGRRRAGSGAGPARPRLRPAPTCSGRPAGPSYTCWSGSTATSPRPSPASCRRPVARSGWASGSRPTHGPRLLSALVLGVRRGRVERDRRLVRPGRRPHRRPSSWATTGSRWCTDVGDIAVQDG